MQRKQLESANDISRMVYCGRTVAIISVVIAHSAYANGMDGWLLRLVSSFACAGVPFFLFAGGLYWKPCSWSALSSKLLRIAVPWICLGSLTWLVSCVGSKTVSIGSWISWILGNGTYLWYMTVYCLILLAFQMPCFRKKWGLVLLCLATLISRSVTAVAYISGPVAFLNPLNWIGFFALGVLMGRQGVSTMFSRKAWWRYALAACSAICLGLFADSILDSRLDYWGYTCVLTQCAWIFVILAMAKLLSGFSGGLVGKDSMFIYLSHISVIGFLSNRFSFSILGNVLLSVLTTLGLYVMLRIGVRLAKKLRIHKLFCYLSGAHKA